MHVIPNKTFPTLPIVYNICTFSWLLSIVYNNPIYYANFNLQVFFLPIATYLLLPSYGN